MMVGGLLTVLSTYLYKFLQLEDYALMLGSVGLFAVLSAIMDLTRTIDGYASPQEIKIADPVKPLEAPAPYAGSRAFSAKRYSGCHPPIEVVISNNDAVIQRLGQTELIYDNRYR